MFTTPSTPWHRASYDQFLSDSLPQLLAERLPLAGYQVIENNPSKGNCSILIELDGGTQVIYPSIPYPDESGIFSINEQPIVVIPTASHEELDRAEISCVGEQLLAHIQENLGQTSNGLALDGEILRAWLPLTQWVNEFIQAQGQPLDTTNWLSRQTHLRRVLIPNREKVVAPGQRGRVCPFETPEGPNIGRVFTIAVGAEIRDRRLVIIDERPEAGLGLSASMLPFLENNDPNRLLMAANMLRQGIVPLQPEPAWVQTGNEPDAADFWCGRNLLTAFVSWGPGTSEDGIILSESAARRMNDPFAVEPGDKLSNRHGSKGVVSYILPDDQMPHLPDGTPVELIYNFPGLRTRMHIGQVREALLSRIARLEGDIAVAPPFHAPSVDEMRQCLARVGLPETGMETLTAGKNGPALERPSAVGWVYWVRLVHLAKDKLKVTNTEAQGQLMGKMECAVLQEAGALHNLHEALTIRSVRHPAARSLVQQIAQGALQPPEPPTPMFKNLAQRLNAAGIQAEYNAGQLAFRFKIPEGPTLKLTRPQPHPWLHERVLEEVGVLPDEPGFARLAEANTRLERMLASRAPERLLSEAESRLQEALNGFFAVLLLPENLTFKEKQNFSARAVLAPGAGLHIDQVGLPETMCWMLFGPQVAAELKNDQGIHPENPQAVQALDRILARSWVIVNRAPSLTSTALLAFHPVRQAHNVIRLNPIVCWWLNADFDGDQAAVHLPLTPESQQEAQELLSVAGQLARNPALIKTLLPPVEAIWGLAYRSLQTGGREEIARIAGVGTSAIENILTHSNLANLLSLILERDGAPAALETLERLAQVGYQAVQASGASMSPFIGSGLQRIPPPESDDPALWDAYLDELSEKILTSTDHLDLNIGPQLLDARARAWNWRSLLMVAGVRGAVADVTGKPFIVRHGYAQGLTPEEMYTCVVGARQGLAQLNVQSDQLIEDSLKRSSPASMNLLARARQSKYPGIIFARAAASGEVDRLEDVASRLIVGLLH